MAEPAGRPRREPGTEPGASAAAVLYREVLDKVQTLDLFEIIANDDETLIDMIYEAAAWRDWNKGK